MALRALAAAAPSKPLAVIFGALTVFGSASSASASAGSSGEGDKKDDKTAPQLFSEYFDKAKAGAPKFPFDLKIDADVLESVQGILKKELEQGALKPLRSAFESGVAGQVGYGFLMGYSSGFCLKKVSKIVAFAVGGAFIAIQSMQYGGLIQVNYEGIQRQVESALDLNKDGKLDAKDAEVAMEKVQKVLSFNMPSGGGFSAGFLMGLRG